MSVQESLTEYCVNIYLGLEKQTLAFFAKWVEAPNPVPPPTCSLQLCRLHVHSGYVPEPKLCGNE